MKEARKHIPCDERPNMIMEKEEKTNQLNTKFSKSLGNARTFKAKYFLDIEKLTEKSHELENELKNLKFSLEGCHELQSKYEELVQEMYIKEKENEEEKCKNFELTKKWNDKKLEVQAGLGYLGKDQADFFEKKEKKKFLDPVLNLFDQKSLVSEEPNTSKLITSYIQYINKFHHIFDQGDFNLAAQLAVNSPNCILRNYSTFLKFKNVSSSSGINSPSGIYCKALINSSLVDNKLCSNLCSEIITCAVSTNDTKLTEHWLQSSVITLTVDIGHLLYAACKCCTKCTCGWTYLALNVYSQVKNYKGVVSCHLKVNNFKHVSRYIQKSNFSKKEFRLMITNYPDVQLLYLFSPFSHENSIVTLPGVISCLLLRSDGERILNVLQEVSANGLHSKSLLTCLLKETLDDDMGEKKWNKVLKICEAVDYDLAEELLSSLITRKCLNNAMTFCILDYIS